MKKDYDKTLTRLIGILSKLSNNERYNSKEFAEEYNVTTRTIQRDINERLKSFPIIKDNNGKFAFMEGFTLNKSLFTNDEMILISLALSQFEDVKNFNKVTQTSLQKLLSPYFINPYFIKQEDIEDIDIESSLIEELENAIKYQNHILIKSIRGNIEVEPYKIAAYDGIWYLLAKDEGDQKIKTFMLKRIKEIKTLSNKHKVSHKYIEEVLDKTHSAWFEDGENYTVKVKVYPEIAHYFKQKDFLQSQKIEDELEDSSLIVTFEVSHDEDIDNIIKSWLPDIEVIEPNRYKEKIKKELSKYLERVG